MSAERAEEKTEEAEESDDELRKKIFGKVSAIENAISITNDNIIEHSKTHRVSLHDAEAALRELATEAGDDDEDENDETPLWQAPPVDDCKRSLVEPCRCTPQCTAHDRAPQQYATACARTHSKCNIVQAHATN